MNVVLVAVEALDELDAGGALELVNGQRDDGPLLPGLRGE